MIFETRKLAGALAALLLFVGQTDARPRRSGEVPDRKATVQSRTQTKARPREKNRTEKPAMSAQQQANINKLKQDLGRIKNESEVTQGQKEQLAYDLRNLAEGTQKPSQQSVDKLAHDLSTAMADGNLTKMEQAQLAQDVATVMNSANIPPSEVEAALKSAAAILESSNVDSADAQQIMTDLNAIAQEMGES